MLEHLSAIFDKLSIIAPKAYIGAGLTVLSIGVGWLASDAPYANLVAIGTALLSFGALAQGIGAPKAVGIIAAIWTAYVLVPALERIIEFIDAYFSSLDCTSTNPLETNDEGIACDAGIKKWLNGS